MNETVNNLSKGIMLGRLLRMRMKLDNLSKSSEKFNRERLAKLQAMLLEQSRRIISADLEEARRIYSEAEGLNALYMLAVLHL